MDLLVHKERRRRHTLQQQAAVLRSEQQQAAGSRQEEGAVRRTAAAEGEAGDPQVRCRRRPRQHLYEVELEQVPKRGINHILHLRWPGLAACLQFLQDGRVRDQVQSQKITCDSNMK